MSYCTFAEIVARSGTTLPQATVEEIIADAGADINARLGAEGLPPDESSLGLKSAAKELVLAMLFTRRRLDGTMPASISTGSFSRSDSPDQAIAAHNAKAASLISEYIEARKRAASLPTEGVTRCDADMPEYRLDRTRGFRCR